jgi:hypothetical protein
VVRRFAVIEGEFFTPYPVTDCDHIETEYPLSALCFHRARCDNGSECSQFPTAVDVSVHVVRVFVKLREMLSANRELAHKLAELEHKVGRHDETIRSLVAAIRNLMTLPEPKKRKIGFKGGEKV